MSKVLLVDDDQELLHIMEKVISSFGYRIVTVGNGEEAIEQLKSDDFDLVITDMVMPQMDGMELLGHIKEKYPDSDVIVATGFSEKYSYSDIIRAGASDYIVKPIGKEELEAKLNRIFRERHIIKAFNKEIKAHKKDKIELQKTLYLLDKRIKELSCLFGISSLREKRSLSLEEIFQQTLELIPPAMQFSDITCAMIDYCGQRFQTENFLETTWQLKSNIHIRARLVGHVTVCYLRERPNQDVGPFMNEERRLIDAIAERMGSAAEHYRAADALQKLHEEFRIREAELARESSAVEKEMPEKSHERRKILVVDDDGDIRKALRKLLAAEGYEVMAAADGIIAFEQMRLNPADLVITDIFMPEQDGIITIREIQKYFPATKIIAVSGADRPLQSTVDYLEVAKRLGAQYTFTKPIDIDLFLDAIKKLLD